MPDFIYDAKSDTYQFTLSSMGLGSTIGIYGCTWDGAQSLSDPTTALSLLNDDLDSIAGLEYSGCEITTTRNDQGIAMALGATDVSYNGVRYLNENEADDLRTKTVNKLNTGGVSSHLVYQDVVVSSNNRT